MSFPHLLQRIKIDIEFKEMRNNHLKVVSTYAKMARGEMVHLLAKHGIKNADDIKALDVMGYRYSSELSGDNKYLFIK